MPSAGALDRIVRRCAAAVDERALRIALVEDLRAGVTFAAHVWALLDPETEVAISPLATVPEAVMAVLPSVVRTRYLTTVNRWTSLPAGAESLHRATGGRPDESRLHRELLRDLGIGDIATVVFRDRHGAWGFLDLWRLGADPPFGDGDLDFLAAAEPAITEALRRCQAGTFDESPQSPERTGPVVLVLAPDLAVRAQTPETDAYLRALLPPEGDRSPVPAGAYNVAAQLLAVEAGVSDHPPLARCSMPGGGWLTFRAARVASGEPTAQQDIAVTIETTSPAERRSLYARSHGLSPRETELLALLVEGAATKEIAEALYISEHTVQDHLKSIFAKTGARNRRTLLSRVTGR